MDKEKEVKFTQKKVDESWKETIDKNKTVDEKVAAEKKQSPPASTASPVTSSAAAESTNETITFAMFVSSLGMQALIHMGDIANPVTKQKDVSLEAAQETIDILTMLEEKTKGNCTADEMTLLHNLLYDLRIRYVEKVRTSSAP